MRDSVFAITHVDSELLLFIEFTVPHPMFIVKNKNQIFSARTRHNFADMEFWVCTRVDNRHRTSQHYSQGPSRYIFRRKEPSIAIHSLSHKSQSQKGWCGTRPLNSWEWRLRPWSFHTQHSFDLFIHMPIGKLCAFKLFSTWDARTVTSPMFRTRRRWSGENSGIDTLQPLVLDLKIS